MTRRLLLCEGPDDVAFFKAFLNERKGLPEFRIKYSSLNAGEPGGNSKFGFFLKGWGPKYGKKIFQEFQEILIISDNDDNPAASYSLVKQQIEEALDVKIYGKRQFSYKKQFNNFRVKILMIPWDEDPGNLETLCFDPAKDADAAMTDKVNRFQADVKADKWHDCRSKEMWLRSYLAAKCKDNPFVCLCDVFDKHKRLDLIPLRSKHFKKIHDELLTFAT